ncbi:DUSAM domain-containing protein [Pyxidicoccus xibeiensis]|uniref:DUSAM domain-containing protein n=1 Tax=Pyxidicoccus xibeiensis TaxID=2906759 RepID=UPI0020A7C206|nr:DUSAM domain-containing protein [Pyxidicoccus xibeiensis]MCP3137159.1 DUSAM domain-containing protein [Pyxidicoccus xibeiensis]
MDLEEGDWHTIRMLESQVQRGEVLELTPDVRELLLRTAPTVAINEADVDLSSVDSATALLHVIRRRISDGSHRLAAALNRMYRLRDAGRLDEARQQLRDLLAVEVVPLYRDIAEGEIEKLNRRG